MKMNGYCIVDTKANRVDPSEAAPAGAASNGSTLFANAPKCVHVGGWVKGECPQK